MQQQANQSASESIMQPGTGFWPAKILPAAVNFQLFTGLAYTKSMPAQPIKALLNLKCTVKNIFDFLGRNLSKMKKILLCLLILSAFSGNSQTLKQKQVAPAGQTAGKEPARIIDMHIHSYDAKHFNNQPKDYYGNKGSSNMETHFTETYEALKKFNIVKAVVSGTVTSVDEWKAKDTDNRIIRGIAINHPADDGMDSTRFENLVTNGQVEIFGEVGAYYSGTTLSDAVWQPYLRICQKYDIPVAVHTGGGDPGGTYSWSPKARLTLGDPYLMDDVLVKYPKLRIYIMHSGEDWHEHALRLMAYYPQLYSDLGAMLWVEPLTQRYVKDFLRNAKQAGYLDRVMFRSDQMTWPYAIKKSIDYLNSLDFLSGEDKQNIFYNNAVRFLKLKK